ncbi:hypothetical protein OFAG_02175, partial [Oxalobacter formigenes HOxBLS]
MRKKGMGEAENKNGEEANGKTAGVPPPENSAV